MRKQLLLQQPWQSTVDHRHLHLQLLMQLQLHFIRFFQRRCYHRLVLQVHQLVRHHRHHHRLLNRPTWQIHKDMSVFILRTFNSKTITLEEEREKINKREKGMLRTRNKIDLIIFLFLFRFVVHCLCSFRFLRFVGLRFAFVFTLDSRFSFLLSFSSSASSSSSSSTFSNTAVIDTAQSNFPIPLQVK
jgi:hypothetical protein